MALLDKLIIADDHPLFQQALQGLLKQHFPEANVVAASCLQQLQQQLALNPDTELVLLDLNLPDSNGFTALTELRQQWPQLGVIVVSGQEDPNTINRSIQLGANAFVPKSEPVAHIIAAIEQVLQGMTWLPNGMVLQPDPQLDEMVKRIDSLSPQQRRILLLFTEGLLNKQIAAQLSLSEATIKAHASAIYLKLGVRTRTQAVIAFNQTQQDPIASYV